MKPSHDQFAFDDNCFLFLNLKIDGSLFHQLLIELAPGISLASTSRPYYVLKAFFEATRWELSTYANTSFSKLLPLIDAFTENPKFEAEVEDQELAPI